MTPIAHHQQRTSRWMLVELGEGETQKREFPLPNRDSTIGRTPESGLCVVATSMSKRHARVCVRGEQIFVEDLESTNGTYVNGNRVGISMLKEGDLLQLGNVLFRIGRVHSVEGDRTLKEGLIPWAQSLIEFDRLMTDRRVIPHFQPIVTMDRRSTPAFEVLARSGVPTLQMPVSMFAAAERLGRQVALSELMREEGLRAALSSHRADARFFLNTHPSEVINERFIASLSELRDAFPDLAIAVEIHEAAITAPESIRSLRSLLSSLDMQLSYDDFGSGQGRLLELGEVPPDVLKFDMQLIRDIDRAPGSRQEMLRGLVRLSIDLGTTPLAEGIETEAEHQVCRELGFRLGQGFLYGRPDPETRSETRSGESC